jgi:type III restriction enzyme
MALHPDFSASPYAPLIPEHRWFPADEELRATAYEKLLPPLVAGIRREVRAWRATGYDGASPTTRALLNHWFETEHLLETASGELAPFRYYFAQREAVETAIWLHEVRRARDKYDLIRFDATGAVSPGQFPEDWPRYVLKLATGAGKTKVLALLIAWSFFHRLYEPGSALARNFLLIAPNIIVLDRLRADFDGLRIFFNDPILPENGAAGRNWRDDFQITLHLQDDVRILRPTGNIFLTNIHRVFLGEYRPPSLEDDDLRDYFLAPFGEKPAGKTTGTRADLGEIIRDINELAVFNDEAHHIHDPRMAWFKSIQDIHHRMLQRDHRLALQIDVTATPRHDSGAIFVQTVADYPLVEAVHQNVVKHPVIPDAESRAKLREKKTAIFTDHYDDYLHLGVEEWKKAAAEHARLGKKAILFVMVDDTKNCDSVGEWLEKNCPELAGAVLVIHTKNNGDITETPTGKNKDELEKLRRQANEIDSARSPFKAIVSVLMLKEGWDVRNVTTIVGLRAYAAKSNILPEQTLGRGLRRMYFGTDTRETVSVLGTPAFMDFVESIQSEGVTLERVRMGEGGGDPGPQDSLIIEIETGNPAKNPAALDIALPRLARRHLRDYDNLAALDPATLGNKKLTPILFPPDDTREIVFKTLVDGAIHHTVTLDGAGPADYRSVVAFFARELIRELHLVGGYEILYPRVRDFIRDHLFIYPVNLEDSATLRNLAEPAPGKIILDTFRAAINANTLRDTGPAARETTASAALAPRLRVSDTRPFRVENRPWLPAKKSLFNRIVGEPRAGGLELAFAAFLEAAPDVQAYAKNYFAIGFRLDYVRAGGDLSTYTPDFLVRATDGTVWIVETKGREELDLPQKMRRLRQWCADATAADASNRYAHLYVDQSGFEKHPPATFAALAEAFTEYK